MRALSRHVVSHPVAVVVAFAIVTIGLGTAALRIRIESSLRTVLDPDDPAVLFYERVRSEFGSDEIGVVGVLADDIFSPATLDKIDRVTRALEDVDGVEEVVSLTNVVDPGQDAYRPPRLMPALRPTAADVARIKERIASTPLYSVNLASADFSATAINVFFSDLSDTEYGDLGIDERIGAILDQENGPEELLYTGAAHVKHAAVRDMRKDLVRFTPVALVIVLGVLAYCFRNLRDVVLAITSVLVALVWTLGTMVLAGKAINLGTFVLPPLLLVIGSSYAIHVLSYYHEQLRGPAAGRRETVQATLDRVQAPLLLSAGTTAVGFGALTANKITAIWDLGIFSVVGIAFLAATSLGLLPALLLLWPDARPEARSVPVPPRLARFLARLSTAAFARRRVVLGFAVATSIAAALGVARIQVDSDFLAYFDASSDVRRANQRINDRIVGSNPFHLVVDGGAPGALEDRDVLRRIQKLQRHLSRLDGVAGSVSVVDYLELLEAGLNTGAGEGGDLVLDEEGNLVPFEPPPPFWEDPASLPAVVRVIKDYPESFQSAVSPDFARGNILVRSTLSGSRQIEALLRDVRGYADRHFPAVLSVRPTGTLVLMTGTTSEIVLGQIRSLALALVAIFAVMAVMFLSARVGLLAILPNALAILIFFGVLGWSGTYLNLGTSLIATIALGIAVDSTIHFMSRLSRELQRVPDERAALEATLGTVGVPVVYTTAALFLGFLTFAGSSFVPIRSFGELTAATLVAALAANLLVLPALLATTKIITVWDLLRVKLGRDPTETIPLLRGLRPAEARIVVLMGELRHLEAGEWIVRRGEAGREMFVMISGHTEAWAGEGEGRRRIGEMRRGDVFGEMALIRETGRSADVVAVDSVEVLVVDDGFLRRIQTRSPRIAARLFLNLSRILSDRLHRMTDRFVDDAAS